MEKKFVVTIGREFGTGGRQIAVELAKILGVELYDKGLLLQLEERYNLSQEEIDKVKGMKKSWWFETISQDLYNDGLRPSRKTCTTMKSLSFARWQRKSRA